MTRRDATIETTHRDAGTAEIVAAAVRPDNTADVVTTVDGATVSTEITRETTGGLQSSVDDYVVNCSVATTVIDAVEDSTDQDSTQATRTDTQPTADSAPTADEPAAGNSADSDTADTHDT